MKPRWLATALEGLSILVRILFLHGDESCNAQVGKIFPKSAALMGRHVAHGVDS